MERRPLSRVQRASSDPQSQFIDAYVHLNGGAYARLDPGRWRHDPGAGSGGRRIVDIIHVDVEPGCIEVCRDKREHISRNHVAGVAGKARSGRRHEGFGLARREAGLVARRLGWRLTANLLCTIGVS
jgi:hypothetical protein